MDMPDVDRPQQETVVPATVTATDIARLADVRRAAVSNWRRRHPDFPVPVAGTSANPVFSLAEVERWFAAHSKQLDISPMDRLWQRIRAGVDDIRLGDLVALLSAALVLYEREPARWPAGGVTDQRELASTLAASVPELRRQPSKAEAGWTGIVNDAAALAAESGPACVLDFLCLRYFETHSRYFTHTPPALADTMSVLAGVSSGTTVLDPACGYGNLLQAALGRGASSLLGQDSNVALAGIALARLLISGGSADIAAGDSMAENAFSGTTSDSVMCDPPFHDRSWPQESLADDPRWEYGFPPRAEPELAWVQHCLAHVRPGGHVAITMPPSAAGRRSGIRIRRSLVRAGALRAVINVPPGASTTEQDVWVLQHPGSRQSPGDVLFVANPPDLSTIESCWHAFTGTDPVSLPECGRAVAVIELLDDEVDLTPARHHQPECVDVEEEFARARSELVNDLQALPEFVPHLASAPPRPVNTVAISELIASGALTLHQAPLRTASDAGDLPVLTAKDLRADRAASGRTRNQPGLVVVAPGDVVLMPGSRDRDVHLIERGGAVLGPQLLLLRADVERIEPAFLAGFLRAARMAEPQPARASGRFDLRAVRIPVPTLAEQRRYGEVFQQMVAFRRKVRHLDDLAAALTRFGLQGIGENRLAPTESARR